MNATRTASAGTTPEIAEFVVGVGASSGADAAEIGALIDGTLAAHGIAPAAVHAVATAAGRGGEEAIRTAARERGWRVVAYPVHELARVNVPNPSALVRARTGTPSVAEAAAVLAARTPGRPGELVAGKRASARATAAVARARMLPEAAIRPAPWPAPESGANPASTPDTATPAQNESPVQEAQ
ncbi:MULTISPECIES: cobalamin biosynthesis protein [Actinomadura]|uniref:Cobalamin biosynthesis protein n=1 Tax=Actinomadura yumaensis TaxID=111807 RepID=A0ABW2D0V7_9ACTN|nr:cobalamin biosynthesis protein [Actinomadura sp. J1-007]MWK37270.1 hypothetical protein [Actinomadura sp. J1-007]